MPIITKTGILLLSGGESSRMGQPKQLLDIDGIPLIQHMVDVAISADLGPVVVVTGAYAEQITPLLRGVEILYNANWNEGMATSIRSGVEFMDTYHAEIDGLFILVCDQPYLKPVHLHSLWSVQQKHNFLAVASGYNNQYGTPVLFTKSLYPDLMSLKGDTGARQFLKTIEERIGSVSFEEGTFDLDTMGDYEEYKRRGSC